MRCLALLLTLTLAVPVFGCTSNPTPHPQNQDTATAAADTQQGSTNTPTSPEDEAEAQCTGLGGAYGADGVCDLALETAFDADSGSAVPPEMPRADVTGVAVSGDAGAYTFAVTVASAETGCDSYADWWEVVTLSGELAYRRVLAHSHVDEQPFVRSGGPVEVGADDLVVVRAHRHPEGYVGDVQVGTAAGGFWPARLQAGFADTLQELEPQPAGCAF